MRGVVMLAMLAGCIEPNLVECADGRACPRGSQCDDARHTCITPEQVGACEGVAELAPCTTSTITSGTCIGGVCIQAGCGNGAVEAGERCDDGGLVSGDGCSADCLSREVCGDGYVDPSVDEECDDGDRAGRDGCTSRCGLESVVWTRQAGAPPLREGAAIVNDPYRRLVIAFGGHAPGGPNYSDTWEWNGSQWRDVSPSASPPERYGHAMAYDPKRHRIVLFGGTNSTFGALRDTWEFDGARWERRLSQRSPSPVRSSAMVFDPRLGKIVYYDGTTWTWDGVEWVELPASTGAPVAQVGMVFDASTNRMLALGANGGLTNLTVELWSFDGATWSPVSTTGGVTMTETYVGFVYDPIRAAPIAITNHPFPNLAVDTWELHGSTWQLVDTTTTSLFIAVLSGLAFAFDIERNQIVEFAGTNGANQTNDVWRYTSGGTWVIDPADAAPSPRDGTSAAYDRVRARVVMAGNAISNGTFEWDGRRWGPGTSGGPTGYLPSMVYDETSSAVLAFDRGSTFRWNGSAWTTLSPAASPPGRIGGGIAFDSARGRAVLFGGIAGVARDDTWEWDGSTWLERTPPTSPPPMGTTVGLAFVGTPVMAYDRRRQRTVLFGGGANPETWEWDGVTWTKPPTVTSPTNLEVPSMIYDRRRERIALFGGSQTSFRYWEWDGVAWTQPMLATQPEAATASAAAYDDARREIVRFGGHNNQFQSATWLGSFRGSVDELCDSGIDHDGDGAIGCADDDCVIACESCGDGTCEAIETDRSCPADCPVVSAVCGDAYCAASESLATCLADCSP